MTSRGSPSRSRAGQERLDQRISPTLTERDRRLVTGYQLYDQGRAAEAEPIYRSLVASYPDDLEAWYQLGEVIVHHNGLRGRSWHEAWQPFQRAIELQPDHELSITHLIPLAVSAGRIDEAEALLGALDPGGAFHPLFAAIVDLLGDEPARSRALSTFRQAAEPELQVTAWLLQNAPGHHQRARDVARLLTEPTRPAPERASGHQLLARVELGQGRRRAAREDLRLAGSLESEGALELSAMLALAPFLSTPRSELEDLRAELERAQAGTSAAESSAPTVSDALRPRLRLYLLRLLSASLGDVAAADRYAGQLEPLPVAPWTGSLVPDLALAVRAEAARGAGETAEALALLERARLQIRFSTSTSAPVFFQDRERFLRAALLGEAGRHEEAIGWYTAVTETSALYGPIAHLRLGELHDQLGNRGKAAEHYARFVAIWEECDAELRPLREGAERRLVALRGGGG